MNHRNPTPVRPRWLVGGLLLLGAAQPASSATFHLWDVAEVYSNAGGTIQYIEFQTTFGHLSGCW